MGSYNLYLTHLKPALQRGPHYMVPRLTVGASANATRPAVTGSSHVGMELALSADTGPMHSQESVGAKLVHDS